MDDERCDAIVRRAVGLGFLNPDPVGGCVFDVAGARDVRLFGLGVEGAELQETGNSSLQVDHGKVLVVGNIQILHLAATPVHQKRVVGQRLQLRSVRHEAIWGRRLARLDVQSRLFYLQFSLVIEIIEH